MRTQNQLQPLATAPHSLCLLKPDVQLSWTSASCSSCAASCSASFWILAPNGLVRGRVKASAWVYLFREGTQDYTPLTHSSAGRGRLRNGVASLQLYDLVRAELQPEVGGACMHQQILRSSFSAVSKPIFPTKYSFFTIECFEIYKICTAPSSKI